MRINIAICDDEKNIINSLSERIIDISKRLNYLSEVYTYTSGKQVIDLICNKKEDLDILLLDIDMPEVSGLEVAKKIRESHSDIILIFISSHEQYVFESIEYNPFRYIRKNRIEKELPIALRAAYSRIEENLDEYMVAKTEDSEVKIKYSDIMYFEKVARKVEIHLSNGKVFAIRKTIKELYEELKDSNFIKIHSGSIVNAKYIDEFSNYDITLDNGERLIMSRRQLKEVKTILMKYWGGKV